MSRESLRLHRTLGAALLGMISVVNGVLGCQGIADIPEVSFSPLCKEYCDTEFRVCTNLFGQYQDVPTCMQVCDILEKNAPNSSADFSNTVQCRLNRLNEADITGAATVDRQALCAAAGPGGGTQCTQASDSPDCEGYCTLYNGACNGSSKNPFGTVFGNDESGDVNACIEKCRAIQPATHLSVSGGQETPGYDWQSGRKSVDTLGCRLYYASRAAVEGEAGCETAGLRPSGPCLGSGDPICANFCKALLVACPTEDLKVYENEGQCNAVCNATELGTKQDTQTVNTIGCRNAHEFNALLIDAKGHCPHVSPLGAGVCGSSDAGVAGGNCEAYCSLAEVACPVGYASNFPGGSDCIERCLMFGKADGDYSVKLAKAGRDTLPCRTLYVTRALEALAKPGATPADADTACKAVFGGDPCVD